MTEIASTTVELLGDLSTGNIYYDLVFSKEMLSDRGINFLPIFDAKSVDEIWDCTAVLKVPYYDS